VSKKTVPTSVYPRQKNYFLVAKAFSVDIVDVMNREGTVCSVFTAVISFSLLLRRLAR